MSEYIDQFLPHLCDPVEELEKTLKSLHLQQKVYLIYKIYS